MQAQSPSPLSPPHPASLVSEHMGPNGSVSTSTFKLYVLNERVFMNYVRTAFVLILFALKWPCPETMILAFLIISAGWYSHYLKAKQIRVRHLLHQPSTIVNFVAVATVLLLGSCAYRVGSEGGFYTMRDANANATDITDTSD